MIGALDDDFSINFVVCGSPLYLSCITNIPIITNAMLETTRIAKIIISMSAVFFKWCRTFLAMSRGVVLRLSYQKFPSGRKIPRIFRVGEQELWLIAHVVRWLFFYSNCHLFQTI